ncbi:MFS transporter [Pseudomonas syringae pv. tomato]|uniref:Membrane protein n=4 Tax=Pseudomonas syringae group TaxID=136849 RepID=A0A3M3RD19_9PSED|nr:MULTISPECIES: MFS transporter [Pseudomonas syringae group]KPB75162.1 Membrane protein [Pseudomonas syringae pv. maculicola str. M6]KPB81140.1 Membrane protein [Pseudomonas syringae pv. maculicola]KPX68527.1 Membrane protein [Pseudomonas syringae pv. maculicola]KTB95899.1 MFS transporter [Pseudomonas syringae ICMP 11292]MBI6848240.1 MFS transporter [Pseudomonas syringae]
MSAPNRVSEKVPVSDDRATLLLLLIAFVDAAGRGLFLAGATFFYTQVVGLSNVEVGIGLALAGLCGLVCAVPIGRLADRLGAARVLAFLQVWRMAGFLIYPFVDEFYSFLLIACFIGCVEQAVWPIIQTLVGSAVTADAYVKTMSKVAIVRNVAYMLAAGMFSIVVSFTTGPGGVIGMLIANAMAFLVSAILLVSVKLPHVVTKASDQSQPVTPPAQPLKNLNFLSLSLCNGILSLHQAVMTIAIPLWLLTKTQAPKSLIGIILVINGIMAITLQLSFSKRGNEVLFAARKHLYAGITLALSCALVAFTTAEQPSYLVAGILLFACVVMTFGELWQCAGAWGISYYLSPVENRAYYLSIYALGANLMTVIFPGILPIAVVEAGSTGWIGLAVVFALAGVATPLLVRSANRKAIAVRSEDISVHSTQA